MLSNVENQSGCSENMGEFHRGPHLKRQNTSMRKFALLVVFPIHFPVFKDVWVRVLSVDKTFCLHCLLPGFMATCSCSGVGLLWKSLACSLASVLWGLQIIFAQLLAQRRGWTVCWTQALTDTFDNREVEQKLWEKN